MDRQNMNVTDDQNQEDEQAPQDGVQGRGWRNKTPEDHQRHVEAGQEAAKTIKARHGADFYQEIGRKGGQESRGGQQGRQDENQGGGQGGQSNQGQGEDESDDQ